MWHPKSQDLVLMVHWNGGMIKKIVNQHDHTRGNWGSAVTSLVTTPRLGLGKGGLVGVEDHTLAGREDAVGLPWQKSRGGGAWWVFMSQLSVSSSVSAFC